MNIRLGNAAGGLVSARRCGKKSGKMRVLDGGKMAGSFLAYSPPHICNQQLFAGNGGGAINTADYGIGGWSKESTFWGTLRHRLG